MKRHFFLFTLMFTFCGGSPLFAQSYWQQSVRYVMDVEVDTQTHRLKGFQKLEYTNRSPDPLDQLFYHLYWNAFQPNSNMDVRSRELGKRSINGRVDWDGRVKDRIRDLKEEETGYQKVRSLKMNGVPQPFTVRETLLQVALKRPIRPGEKVVLEMEFESQIPLQIRRSGRDNPQTGVRYSMSQWYPKICEYDRDGWHPTPYVAREFYGVWGDFEVTIRIDSSYKIGATGVLANAADIGWGYDKPGTPLKPCATAKRSWVFKGQRIHDFVWAADPDYHHLSRKVREGLVLHVIYNRVGENATRDAAWNMVLQAADTVLPFIEKRFGTYPYPQYSFIQGGDGGMEYPMATLVGSASLGTAFHEWMHSWYQMMLGSNEGRYAWMDEGFTSYAEDLVSAFYYGRNSITEYREALSRNPTNEDLKRLVAALPDEHSGAYANYFTLVKSGVEEPMSTHADHYNTNFAYSLDAYSKGEVFLEQLGYVIGAEVRDSVLKRYYRAWRFKHPDPWDFLRIAEQSSGLHLDWYLEYWMNSTKTIDYSIDSLWEEGGMSHVRLKRLGQMPMPIDLRLEFKDGRSSMHLIPLDLMMGAKKNESSAGTTLTEADWRWTHPYYVVTFRRSLKELVRAEIDPSRRMADTDRKNNLIELKW